MLYLTQALRRFSWLLFLANICSLPLTQGSASECERIVREVTYVIPAVRGASTAPRIEIERDHYYGGIVKHELIEPQPLRRTDIFSENPQIRVNFADVHGVDYKKVYLQGPRRDVLEHLILIKTREAENLDLSMVTLLARAPISDVELFLARYPLSADQIEIPGVESLVKEIKARRQALEVDAQRSQLTSPVKISLEFKKSDTTPPPLAPQRSRFWIRLPELLRPQSGFENLIQYLSLSRIPYKISADGMTVTAHISTHRSYALGQIYRAINMAYRTGLIPSMNPMFAQTVQQLDEHYPPSERVQQEQLGLIEKAEQNKPEHIVFRSLL